MSDDLVKQSIAELQDIVHCDCGSVYLERGRHSHACLHYMADALKIVTDRIEELEAKLDWVIVERDETFALMLDRAQTAEAKLAKAVELAEKSIKWLRLYGADVHREAATLVELTGGKDE